MLKISRLPDGRYVRNLGYLPSRSQPKFYLGRDEREALLRLAQLEKLWEWWSSICTELGDDRPAWDDCTLTVARAISEGRATVSVSIDTHPELAVALLSGLQSAAPNIAISLHDEELQTEGQAYWRKEGEKLIEEGRKLLESEGNQRLFEALDAYIEYISKDYMLPNGRVSEWGRCKIRMIEFCKKNMRDVRLAELDTEAAYELKKVITRRPVATKTGRPISIAWAKSTLKEFRVFLRWLHRSKRFTWKRPDDYEVLPMRILSMPGERANVGALRVRTYSLEELEQLWAYATPWERSLITLGMNCGFGMGEIGTLRTDEILLMTAHPLARQLHLESSDGDSWIQRTRVKTNVYGEWLLWPSTVAAIKWLQVHRPTSESPYLVVTKGGSPLKIEGHRNSTIMNTWKRLTVRVRRDLPDFPQRSFNKLRKTSSNLIRLEFGDEIASLFLSHGTPVHNDELLKHYTNPRYRNLHEAIRWLGDRVAPHFCRICDPFPAIEKHGGANISLGKIRRIQAMARQGFRAARIAEELGVSQQTVARWSRRAERE